MATVITRTHYLTVNSIPLSTPAYWITNLEAELLSFGELRGSDQVVPHAAGVLANIRRYTATVKNLEMVIIGGTDRENAAQADQMAGLVKNVEYLQANLGIASTSGNGTVTAVWTRSNSTATTFPVTVLGLRLGKLTDRPMVRAVLQLSLPAGVLPAAV